MLASPIEDAAEVAGELADLAVEDKFDGIRAHAHKSGVARRALLADARRRHARSFPSRRRRSRPCPASSCSTARSWRGAGRAAPGLLLPPPAAARTEGARRRTLLAEIPAAFIAYDCLAHRRRSRSSKSRGASAAERLEAIAAASSGELRLSEVVRAATAAELECALRAARARGNEGLMLKRMRLRLPGRQARASAWRKWKKALGDPRRRRDRRRAGTRQARRDALGLHLRRARRRTGSSTSARPTRG